MGLIPESGRSSGENMEIHSIILAWRICWTEEPGGLQTMGSQKDMTEVTQHVCIHLYIFCENYAGIKTIPKKKKCKKEK